MPDQRTETVAKTLFDGWISRFGAPEFVTTYQCRNFDGHPSKLSRCSWAPTEPERPTTHKPTEWWKDFIDSRRQQSCATLLRSELKFCLPSCAGFVQGRHFCICS
ncbi:hypothetical protein HNY73_018960 [Argiope bruennichi]|uniref:Uncharacterized protein n=1 Tax=Argiope bruennichi TaxID=94029 RepID=A0A8T0EFR8_ARGBR|nr:hypothetical protein HNY73_018960 [Argiope bruennichi]